MKKILLILAVAFTTPFLISSCEEKTPKEKFKDSMKDVGDEMKDLGDDLKDGTKDIGEEIKEGVNKTKDAVNK